jgi:hypothetical protein
VVEPIPDHDPLRAGPSRTHDSRTRRI